MRRIVVSMFDESGNAVRPWAEAGFECHCFDLLNDGRVERFASGGSITFHHADLFDWATIAFIVSLRPYIVFGFPPCTDLATCGAKHFAKKLADDPFCQVRAVALARQVEVVGELTGAPWFAENPKSILSTLWRKRDYAFHPSDYGGYLPEDDVHPRWPQFIPPRDAYTKETWLWTGNGFVLPPRRPVVDIGYFQGWTDLGGKSERTKRIRSETARGFASAVFFANWTLKQFRQAA